MAVAAVADEVAVEEVPSSEPQSVKENDALSPSQPQAAAGADLHEEFKEDRPKVEESALPGDPKHQAPVVVPEVTEPHKDAGNLMKELAELEENGHNHDVHEPMQEDNFQQSEQEDEEDQPPAIPDDHLAENGVDYVDLRRQALEVRAYMGFGDAALSVPDEIPDKEAALALVKELNDKVMQEVLRNEELIENLRASNPDADRELPKEKFAISKSTKSTCVDFLEENDVEITSWIGEANESERVKKILKVWFALVGQYNKERWC